jgi:uncharacterized membrane protein YgcG
MSPLARSVVVIALWLALAGRSVAVAPEIKDDGKFFSAETIKKANDEIREIAAKYGRDFLLESYATVPADQVAKVKEMNKKERNAFFRAWAAARMKERAVNGVYVLVCKDPAYLLVGFTAKAKESLGADARDKIEEILRKEFEEKRYDQGLLAAIKFVREKLASSK